MDNIMNNKIIISIAVIITITIVAFSISQIEIINEKETSYFEQSEQENSMLEKIREDKIKNDESENPFIPKEREWQRSGGFLIDRSEYVLGEKIFVNINYIDEDIKGQMLFSKIINSTTNQVYKKINFDGSKPQQNFYLSIWPSIPSGFCDKDSLVGEWKVDFVGIDNESLKFKIIDYIIPGMEKSFVPMC